MLTRSWKKPPDSGVVLPVKMNFPNKCSDTILCDDCENQVDEKKKFRAYLNLIKRQAPNQVGHMFAY